MGESRMNPGNRFNLTCYVLFDIRKLILSPLGVSRSASDLRSEVWIAWERPAGGERSEGQPTQLLIAV